MASDPRLSMKVTFNPSFVSYLKGMRDAENGVYDPPTDFSLIVYYLRGHEGLKYV